MHTFASALCRGLSCGAGATLITLVLGVAFVQATSAAPATHADSSQALALQVTYGWFGQPEPAVLVD